MSTKTLIVHTAKTSFVREDLEIISSLGPIKEYHFVLDKNPVKLFFNLMKLKLFMLFKGRKYKQYYIWFADYHAYFPVFFGKLYKRKTFIVLGGYDTMAIPEIDYGVFLKNNLRRRLIKYAISHADYLLGVDQSMFATTNYYINVKGRAEGVEAFVPKIKGEKIVMPTGYDPEKWKKPEDISKKAKVVTIGAVSLQKIYLRKGFDLFASIAKAMPQYEFIIIGPDAAFKKKIDDQNIKNLTVYSFMPQEEMMKLLFEAKVYCQLSIAEGLPNSLCEGMLCECVPVGSSANGIPGAIEDEKLILQKPDVEEAKKIIEYAMSMDEEKGKHFRQLVIDKYPKTKRKETLKKLLA